MNTPTSLTIAEVAARLNVPISVVRQMIRDAKLYCVRYNRKVLRIPLWSVEDHEKTERLFRIPTKPSYINNS